MGGAKANGDHLLVKAVKPDHSKAFLREGTLALEDVIDCTQV
jgi:hypothetical protein